MSRKADGVGAAGRLGVTTEMADQAAYDNAVARFADRGIALPTFAVDEITKLFK